jgi:ribosomal protein L19
MLFFNEYLKTNNIIKDSIMERKSKRDNLFSRPGLEKFKVGDILVLFFWVKGILYHFEGICICIKKKNFKKIDVTLILRNVLNSIGVELTISYFYNRLFFLKFSDYKRKNFIYKRAKLYFLRQKYNRQSNVSKYKLKK